MPALTPSLRNIAPGVRVAEARQGFLGLEVGTRMTVLALREGLLVHSPIDLEPEAVAGLGTPGWVLAPNLFHHLYAGSWAEAGWELWAAPGLQEKRPDLPVAGVPAADAHPFGDDVEVLPLTCFPTSNEVVVLHRPSRTLITTDLVFHFGADAPWGTRTAMRCIGGYPGCRTTLLERLGMKRDLARQEIATILTWDFDRLIMAHGDIIETGGHAALRDAFRWFGPLP